MPPCAAPVWERVGESLEITPVRSGVDDSSAARIPAPPAPTITTSYWWVCIGVDAFLSLGVRASGRAERRQQVCRRAGRARVEREDHQGAQHDDDGEGEVQHGLEEQPQTVS